MKQKLIISALLILLISVFVLPLMTGGIGNVESEETDMITTTEETVSITTTEKQEDNISQTVIEPTVAIENTKPTKAETTTEEPNNTYSDDDLFYLAAAVCNEAGGEPEETQLLVANVIINRVNSPLYPNTIYGVLTQYGQYDAMWKNGISFPKWATNAVRMQCYNVARRILNGERHCPENVLFQAEFKQGSGVYKQINNTYFCYI